MKLEFDINNDKIFITAETPFEEHYLNSKSFIQHQISKHQGVDEENKTMAQLVISKEGA